MKSLKKLAIILAFLVPAQGFAEDASQKTIHDFVTANQKAIVGDMANFMSMPNVATNPDDILANAKAIAAYYQLIGFESEILDAPGGPVSLYLAKDYPGATKTVTFYIHFDGQPVDPSRWANPPFQATVRAGRLEDNAEIVDFFTHEGPVPEDWRIYGRSASDDKAPVVGLFYALKALEAAGVTPSVNVKVFLDGAEEMGSPNLQGLVEKYGDKLKSDLWLFLDGPQDQRGNPRVVLGVRGTIGFELVVYGPERGLHSGHYGNFAPNPALRLAHLLASMRDENGHTLIEGFYDEVRKVGDIERELIAAIPDGDALVMKDAGISAREYPEMRYEEALLDPAFNIRGLSVGGVGDNTRNIIDSRAIASIGIRMAPDMTIEKTHEVVEAHIEAQGYHIVREEPTLEERLTYPKIAKVDWSESGYVAVRTDPNNPYVKKLVAIMQDMTGGETIVYPTLGGSLPLAHIVLPLDVPFAVLPIANQDNSQHAPNENIRLGHLFKGIEIYAEVLREIGQD